MKSNRLCICSSVYQIFNIINLYEMSQGKMSADLCIVDYGTSILDDVNIEYLRSFFNNVYLISACRLTGSKKAYIRIILTILKTKIKSFFCKKYKEIFLTGTEIYSKMIAMMHSSKETSVYYYEDGLESYDAILDRNSKIKQDKVFAVLYGTTPIKKCVGLFVYEPSLVLTNDYDKKIYSIEKIKRGLNHLINLKNVFTMIPKEIPGKVVFLEAWFINNDQYDYQADLFRIVASYFPSKDICVKTHPNANKKVLNEAEGSYCGSKCFEINNYFFPVEKKLIVSIISTAAITPKILYNEEPRILFLYKLFLKKYSYNEWNRTDLVVRRIKQRYSDPSRIMIPESFEQLSVFLSRFSMERE